MASGLMSSVVSRLFRSKSRDDNIDVVKTNDNNTNGKLPITSAQRRREDNVPKKTRGGKSKESGQASGVTTREQSETKKNQNEAKQDTKEAEKDITEAKKNKSGAKQETAEAKKNKSEAKKQTAEGKKSKKAEAKKNDTTQTKPLKKSGTQTHNNADAYPNRPEAKHCREKQQEEEKATDKSGRSPLFASLRKKSRPLSCFVTAPDSPTEARRFLYGEDATEGWTRAPKSSSSGTPVREDKEVTWRGQPKEKEKKKKKARRPLSCIVQPPSPRPSSPEASPVLLPRKASHVLEHSPQRYRGEESLQRYAGQGAIQGGSGTESVQVYHVEDSLQRYREQESVQRYQGQAGVQLYTGEESLVHYPEEKSLQGSLGKICAGEESSLQRYQYHEQDAAHLYSGKQRVEGDFEKERAPLYPGEDSLQFYPGEKDRGQGGPGEDCVSRGPGGGVSRRNVTGGRKPRPASCFVGNLPPPGRSPPPYSRSPPGSSSSWLDAETPSGGGDRPLRSRMTPGDYRFLMSNKTTAQLYSDITTSRSTSDLTSPSLPLSLSLEQDPGYRKQDRRDAHRICFSEHPSSSPRNALQQHRPVSYYGGEDPQRPLHHHHHDVGRIQQPSLHHNSSKTSRDCFSNYGTTSLDHFPIVTESASESRYDETSQQPRPMYGDTPYSPGFHYSDSSQQLPYHHQQQQQQQQPPKVYDDGPARQCTPSTREISGRSEDLNSSSSSRGGGGGGVSSSPKSHHLSSDHHLSSRHRSASASHPYDTPYPYEAEPYPSSQPHHYSESPHPSSKPHPYAESPHPSSKPYPYTESPRPSPKPRPYSQPPGFFPPPPPCGSSSSGSRCYDLKSFFPPLVGGGGGGGRGGGGSQASQAMSPQSPPCFLCEAQPCCLESAATRPRGPASRCFLPGCNLPWYGPLPPPPPSPPSPPSLPSTGVPSDLSWYSPSAQPREEEGQQQQQQQPSPPSPVSIGVPLDPSWYSPSAQLREEEEQLRQQLVRTSPIHHQMGAKDAFVAFTSPEVFREEEEKDGLALSVSRQTRPQNEEEEEVEMLVTTGAKEEEENDIEGIDMTRSRRQDDAGERIPKDSTSSPLNIPVASSPACFNVKSSPTSVHVTSSPVLAPVTSSPIPFPLTSSPVGSPSAVPRAAKRNLRLPLQPRPKSACLLSSSESQSNSEPSFPSVCPSSGSTSVSCPRITTDTSSSSSRAVARRRGDVPPQRPKSVCLLSSSESDFPFLCPSSSSTDVSSPHITTDTPSSSSPSPVSRAVATRRGDVPAQRPKSLCLLEADWRSGASVPVAAKPSLYPSFSPPLGRGRRSAATSRSPFPNSLPPPRFKLLKYRSADCLDRVDEVESLDFSPPPARPLSYYLTTTTDAERSSSGREDANAEIASIATTTVTATAPSTQNVSKDNSRKNTSYADANSNEMTISDTNATPRHTLNNDITRETTSKIDAHAREATINDDTSEILSMADANSRETTPSKDDSDSRETTDKYKANTEQQQQLPTEEIFTSLEMLDKLGHPRSSPLNSSNGGQKYTNTNKNKYKPRPLSCFAGTISADESGYLSNGTLGGGGGGGDFGSGSGSDQNWLTMGTGGLSASTGDILELLDGGGGGVTGGGGVADEIHAADDEWSFERTSSLRKAWSVCSLLGHREGGGERGVDVDRDSQDHSWDLNLSWSVINRQDSIQDRSFAVMRRRRQRMKDRRLTNSTQRSSSTETDEGVVVGDAKTDNSSTQCRSGEGSGGESSLVAGVPLDGKGSCGGHGSRSREQEAVRRLHSVHMKAWEARLRRKQMSVKRRSCERLNRGSTPRRETLV